MSSNVSPCGRYEYTGETKIVDGVTVKRYKVCDDADLMELQSGLTLGQEMGFIDDWGTIEAGGSVRGDGVAIDSALYGNAIVWGHIDESELGGNAIVQAGAHVLRCDLDDQSMVLSGAQVADVTLRGESLVRDGAIVAGNYCEIALHSIDVPGDAEILDNSHLLILMVTTSSQLRTLVYRKKAGGGGR